MHRTLHMFYYTTGTVLTVFSVTTFWAPGINGQMTAKKMAQLLGFLHSIRIRTPYMEFLCVICPSVCDTTSAPVLLVRFFKFGI